MTILLDSRRRSAETLKRNHPAELILDVTSHGPEPWVGFSPFYPHGDIPVPFSPGITSQTVEGIWQAMKVFESADVDASKLTVSTMKGIKRTVRRNGPVLGHREGMSGTRLLSYVEARRQIYLPSYLWVLRYKVQDLVENLRRLADGRGIVLLDYSTNDDICDTSSALSHAALVRRYVEGTWPV